MGCLNVMSSWRSVLHTWRGHPSPQPSLPPCTKSRRQSSSGPMIRFQCTSGLVWVSHVFVGFFHSKKSYPGLLAECTNPAHEGTWIWHWIQVQPRFWLCNGSGFNLCRLFSSLISKVKKRSWTKVTCPTGLQAKSFLLDFL